MNPPIPIAMRIYSQTFNMSIALYGASLETLFDYHIPVIVKRHILDPFFQLELPDNSLRI
jgi:hypothetical protein